MNSRNRRLVVALVLLACLIVAASAYGAASTKGVRRADLNGVARALQPNGALKARAVGHLQLKDHIVTCRKLAPALARSACKPSANTAGVGKDGKNGVDGSNGQDGRDGKPGDSYLKGAYYAVAYYDVGDTNAGAIATVACKSQADTAISGGVQVLGANTPVSSSFPGRMDWTTNTPKAGRLDGWIIQFGGNAGPVSDKDPLTEKVWALCVPGLELPVTTTFTQSS